MIKAKKGIIIDGHYHHKRNHPVSPFPSLPSLLLLLLLHA